MSVKPGVSWARARDCSANPLTMAASTTAAAMKRMSRVEWLSVI
jgi:hypothetical protein